MPREHKKNMKKKIPIRVEIEHTADPYFVFFLRQDHHVGGTQHQGYTADTNYLFHQSIKNINFDRKIFFSL
jgi:hypothetical protein